MLRFRHLLGVLCLYLLCLFVTTVQAQDAHHWDNQYGTKGSMLGGIVVGSPSDLSASFYNPGWIAHSDDPSFLMSTKAWEAAKITVKDGLKTGIDPTSSHIGSSPGFMAWQISSRVPEGWQLVFSSLSRIRFEYNSSVTWLSEDSTPGSENNQWYLGEAYRHAKTSENWFGMTMARTFSESLSGGITFYGIYRSQRSRLQVSASSMGAGGDYSTGRTLDEFKFKHARMLAKIGLAYKGDPLSFGITITTPSMGVMGDGQVFQQTGFSSTADINGTPTEAYLAADIQTGLEANWQSPLALAIGASWQLGKTRLHFSSEWFNAVVDQVIMEPANYFSQSNGQEFSYENEYSYESIINFGFGVDHNVREDLALYASFRSDFSILNDDNVGNFLLADWDIWHLSAGASFEIIGLELTAGLQYSFGNGNTNRYLNLGSEVDPTLVSDFSSSDVSYRHLKFMLGFDFSLSPS